MEVEKSKKVTLSRVYYEVLLLRQIDRCVKAKTYGDEDTFIEGVEALYLMLVPELKNRVRKEFSIKYDGRDFDEVYSYIDHYYIHSEKRGFVLGIAEDLFETIIGVLDEAGMLRKMFIIPRGELEI
ncbi:hypothetical protein DRN87_02215 [Candidatus Geothermarchaeota archaeon]|nr:MAG: hypothetical protein DRN87_02215 [Candidatus Geothermarchaeota archaeon]